MNDYSNCQVCLNSSNVNDDDRKTYSSDDGPNLKTFTLSLICISAQKLKKWQLQSCFGAMAFKSAIAYEM